MDSFALQIHLRSKDSCEIWILDPMRASFDQSRIPCRVPPYLWRTLNFKAWRVHCHQWWCVIDREHKFESPCGSALKKSKSKTKTFSTRDSRVIPGLVWYRQTLIVYLKESLFLSKSPAALVATCSPEICQTITYSTTSTHLNRNILNWPQYWARPRRLDYPVRDGMGYLSSWNGRMWHRADVSELLNFKMFKILQRSKSKTIKRYNAISATL